MRNTLGKQERLKSKKLIEKLYAEGDSVKNFPLRMMYVQTVHTSEFPCQVGVSVAKRNYNIF
jgi:ribonuclease P protein component